MTQDEHNPDTDAIPSNEEPLIDDDKPVSNRYRFLLIMLTVGMFFGGIYWNYLRSKAKKEQRETRQQQAPIAGPRYVDPPPAEAYPWMKEYDAANSIAARIPPPPGTVRVDVPADSFANWLRYLPIRTSQDKVLLHDGQPKRNQRAHWAVLDIDTGANDLQKSAQAILRLRAEYLFSQEDFDAITFHVSLGESFPWNRWRRGDRPNALEDGYLNWKNKAAKPDDSYANFRQYLNALFKYADTNTLLKDLQPASEAKEMRIGDVFLHPGQPGHAVIVVDMIQDPKSGDKGFLLAQSFFPAQDLHILVNAYDPQGPPWYRTNYNDKLQTPEWAFQANELMRMP